MKTKITFLFITLFFSFNLSAQVKILNRIGQTPGGAGYYVNYDSLSKRLYVGCSTSVWVYDVSDTTNIHVIAKRPLLGLITETSLYGNVLFVAATHDGVFALDATSDSLTILAHYDMKNMGDTAAYHLWRSNDTLFVADNFKIRMLKYIPGTGFVKLMTFGPDNSYCVTRRGNTIAIGSQGLSGTISVYKLSNLTTPLATWNSSLIFAVQNVRFADLRNDIIYVCGGPGDLLFTKSSLFALQLSGSSLMPIDTFTVSGGIIDYAQMNIMNLDSRHDTLYVVTTAAFDLSTFPYTYMPIIDASGLPNDTMRKIGYVIPGLWHFSTSLMDGTPYIAMSSEWCGVLISNVSHLQPHDTLKLLETGGWCYGSKIRHDTIWALQEGYGLVAYKTDSLYYHNGFMTKSKILHIYRQFISDFDFLNDTLIVLTSAYSDIYSIKHWLTGGTPVKVDSLGIGNTEKMKFMQTNTGPRLVVGWSNVLSPPVALLLVDPFSTAHPRPTLDSIQTRCNLYSLMVSHDTVFCGLEAGNKYYLAVYKVYNDAFVFIDSIHVPAEINSITKENNIIAIGCKMNLVWYRLTGSNLVQLGSYFDWFLNAISVNLKNKLLYVADKFYGMKIFDISQLTSATLVAKCRGTGGSKNLYGSDDIELGNDGKIYLGDFQAGIIIIEPYDTTLTGVAEHNDFNKNNHIQLYPNPASDKLTIKCNDFSNGSYDLCISDITGQMLIQKKVNVSVVDINIHDLSNGIYIVTLKNSQGIEVKKFIKE